MNLRYSAATDAIHFTNTQLVQLYLCITGQLHGIFQNNGQNILWDHVIAIYKSDLDRELQRTKLTAEHVYLTPHSVMRVNLAAHVFLIKTAITYIMRSEIFWMNIEQLFSNVVDFYNL